MRSSAQILLSGLLFSHPSHQVTSLSLNHPLLDLQGNAVSGGEQNSPRRSGHQKHSAAQREVHREGRGLWPVPISVRVSGGPGHGVLGAARQVV